MRYLIKTLDLDDARWLVIVILMIGLLKSHSRLDQIEVRTAALAARDKEPETRVEECAPAPDEWSKDSIYSEPAVAPMASYVETCGVKPLQLGGFTYTPAAIPCNGATLIWRNGAWQFDR